MDKKFKLHYSPLFYDDLDKITDYILYELKNFESANNLISGVEESIKRHLMSPVNMAPYKSIKEREYQYRGIIIGNYLIFYVVIDDKMIVRRILYGKSEIDKIL